MEACRARLYRMIGQSMDAETPKPCSAWRESCKKVIIPEVCHLACILGNIMLFTYICVPGI